jgi:prepilin-type N-terminal cleavage/methylation domain-containing protein
VIQRFARRARRPTRGRRDRAAGAPADRGFTLVEVVIALALSAVIAGVTISAMLTSMNVADSTSEQIRGSNDSGLVSAWFYRDAQAADPAGISVTDDAAGWQGCTQQGSLVVRFASTGDGAARVVTYALLGSQLTRRACAGPESTTVTLAEHLATAIARCAPDAGCGAGTTAASLRVTGDGERAPIDQTFTASLRGAARSQPAAGKIPAPLVVLGGGAACPVLQVASGAAVTVAGDVVVAGDCGSTPVDASSGALVLTGTTAVAAGAVPDPLAGIPAPAVDCAGDQDPQAAPDPGGALIEVHPQPVEVTDALALAPGTYVFCDGLTLSSTAVVTGTDVTLIVEDGELRIDGGAVIDIAAPATGELANVVVWARSPSAVHVELATTPAGALRGLVYAPSAPVTIDVSGSASIGGVVARSVAIGGTGALALGAAPAEPPTDAP